MKGKAGKILLVFVGFLLVCGVIGLLTGKGGKKDAAPVAATAVPTATEVAATAVPTEAVSEAPAPEATAVPLVADWQKVFDAARAEFVGSEFFPYVKDVAFTVNEERGFLTLTAVVDDSTADTVALELADTLLRRLNAVAGLYNTEVAGATKGYYGGLYDAYTAAVGVSAFSNTEDAGKWYVNTVITKGMHTKQAPTLQGK